MVVMKIWNMKAIRLIVKILSNALIILLVFFIITLLVPYFQGLKQFAVLSNSMGRTIPYGSIVYVENVDFNDVKPLDIATFMSLKDLNKSFTHRIVSIDTIKKSFVTKGDANPTDDPVSISTNQLVGRVKTIIPLAGLPYILFNNFGAKIVAFLLLASWIATEIELFVKKRKKRNDAL